MLSSLQAIELGIPAVEIDLDFTKDGVGVLIHGPKVDDTTDGQGLVSEHTFEQIQALNASSKDLNKYVVDDYCVSYIQICWIIPMSLQMFVFNIFPSAFNY